MVRVRDGPAGARRRGKLSGEPAVLEAAALALDSGYDPLRFLGLHPDDQKIVAQVITEAQKIRHDRDKNVADYLAGKTAGLTARSITRWIARSFRRR